MDGIVMAIQLFVIVGLDPTIHDTQLTIFLERNLHTRLISSEDAKKVTLSPIDKNPARMYKKA